MTQMQRSFSLLSTSSSSFFRATSSCSSSSYLQPVMYKLQSGALDHPGFCLPCTSPFSTGQRFGQCTQLKLRKPRVSSVISVNHSRNLQSLADRTMCALAIRSCLTHGSLGCVTAGNILNYWSLNSGITCSHDFGASCKRHFSQVSRVKDEKENKGGFSKHWKQVKPLAAVGKDAATNSSVSAFNNTMPSSEEIFRDLKPGSAVLTSPVSDSNPTSKVNGRRKKQSRSKKNEEQLNNRIDSEETAVKKSSKSTARAKKSTASKNVGDSMQASESKSGGNTAEQVPDASISTIQPSTKKSGSSRRKGKSAKAVNKSSEKQEAQNMGKLKSLGQGTVKPLYPPIGKSVMVVESVTKAKVIQGYLGHMFEVLPSYGHVRDLAARSGSVRPDDDFSMVWEVPSAAWTHLKSIKVALNGAQNLIIASDPDREGEAIAWHIIEMLHQQDALHQEITVARVVFHEITDASIKSALQQPRLIDENLVHSYLARRALDYLIGFNISPLLWRKLPGCQSAGRVQSAALSLISDREMEIDEFKPQEYWTIEVGLNKKEHGSLVNAHLTHVDSKKLNQFSISSQAEAKDIEQKINSEEFHVVGLKKNKTRRNPPTPYITSTLQQDAANKLHFSATYTMKLAQKLYEGVQLSDGKATGLITYVRTDGLQISDEAVQNIQSLIIERYGQNFASGVRKYFKKVKNAQEAHEAIRPTDIRRLPSMLFELLDEDSLKLYTLIWSRTVACQMEPLSLEQAQVDIGNAHKSIVFRSACSKVEFPGYQAVYEDVETKAIRSKENYAHDLIEAFEILNSLKPGDPVYLGEVELKQHFTQPPPRYSEGSLVKKLEELGIGRPSTYASTLKVLKDRNYVTVKNRVLYPEFRGRMVTTFLSHHFTEVTDYSFTADMETELDNVSAGLTEWKGLLRDYWTRFSSYCKRAESLHIHQVEKMLEKTFGNFLFGSLPDNDRTCPSCLEGTLIFKVSKFGAGYFIGCDQHPRCKYIATTLYGDDDEEETPQESKSVEEPKLLGVHPASNEKILLKNGPYGFYVQLGEDKKGYIPKRASLSHIKDVDSVTVEDALELLRFPVTLGNHPKDGHPVILKLARIGFSVRHRRTIASVPKNMKPDEVTLEKALELLSGKNVRRSGRPKSIPKLEEAVEAL